MVRTVTSPLVHVRESDPEPVNTRGAIQVLDRMVALLDELAIASDPVSLKDLSGEPDCIHQPHIESSMILSLHAMSSGSSQELTSLVYVYWNWVIWSKHD